MDDIEDILKRMALRKPSGHLDERVLANALHGSPRSLRLRRMAGYLSAAAALAIAVALGVAFAPHGSTVSLPEEQNTFVFEPVRRDTLVSHLSDEGVMFLNDQLPMRRIKRQTIQRVQWVDDARAIGMETTLPPQEQWVLVPISFD